MKNLQLLTPLHTTIKFLRCFNQKQLQYIAEISNIFVFTRGTVLAKQGERIDFLGIVLEGKVNQAGVLRSVNHSIGHLGLLGIQQCHSLNCVADNDGIIFTIRLQTILLMKAANDGIRKKIIDFSSQKSIEMLKPGASSREEWQEVDQRILSKNLDNDLKDFVYKALDVKQRQKFLAAFPPMGVQQKQKIISKTSKPYLLMVLKGQLIVKGQQKIEGLQVDSSPLKTSKNKKILGSGQVYNVQGFLLNFTTSANIYCLSSDAAFLLIDRQQCMQILEGPTFHKLLSVLLQKQIHAKSYHIGNSDQQKSKQQQIKDWNPFMKNDYEIVELKTRKKKDILALTANVANTTSASKKQKQHLSNFQTLYKQQMGNKQKTKSSVSQGAYGHLLSLRTEQNQATEVAVQQQKKTTIEKELSNMAQKVDRLTFENKSAKLEVIELRSRLKLGQVFKEINSLKYTQRKIEGSSTNGAVSMKQVFDSHMKQNKIKLLVAKCAYKWLQRTRQTKASKSS